MEEGKREMKRGKGENGGRGEAEERGDEEMRRRAEVEEGGRGDV